MAITLIGSPVSPYVRKVNLLLLEKGIEFELDPVTPFNPPDDFKTISPLGKIPALRHDDRILNDSSVICRYLENLQPAPSFYPSEAYDCARAEWIEEYVDGGLIPVAGPGVFQPRVLMPMMGKEADEAKAQKTIDEELPAFYDYLEAQIDGRAFFAGDSLSIADLTVGGGFINLQVAGVVPDAARWPQLTAFLVRIQSRDSFQQVIAPVKASLGKLWIDLN